MLGPDTKGFLATNDDKTARSLPQFKEGLSIILYIFYSINFYYLYSILARWPQLVIAKIAAASTSTGKPPHHEKTSEAKKRETTQTSSGYLQGIQGFKTAEDIPRDHCRYYL